MTCFHVHENQSSLIAYGPSHPSSVTFSSCLTGPVSAHLHEPALSGQFVFALLAGTSLCLHSGEANSPWYACAALLMAGVESASVWALKPGVHSLQTCFSFRKRGLRCPGERQRRLSVEIGAIRLRSADAFCQEAMKPQREITSLGTQTQMICSDEVSCWNVNGS